MSEYDPTDQGVTPARARRTDPETSKEAAASIPLTRLATLERAIVDFLRRVPGSTAREIMRGVQTGPGSPDSQLYVAGRDSISPRLAEMREAGILENEPKGSKSRTSRDVETRRSVLRWWLKGESPTSRRPGQGALFQAPRVFD